MSNKREQFLSGYNGKSLLDKYPLTTYGTWRIFGEDGNPDFGGSHHCPELSLVEGTLNDLIDYAVALTRVWAWGSGGDICFVNTPLKIVPDTVKKIRELQEKKNELRQEIDEIDKQLACLGVE